MLDMRMVPAAEVPAAIAGRVLMWFGDDGVLYRRDVNGQTAAVGVGPPGRDSGNVMRVIAASQETTGNQESSVLQMVMPANTMRVGDVITLEAMGRFTSTAVASSGLSQLRVGVDPVVNNNTILTWMFYGNAATARASQIARVSALISVRDGGSGMVALTGGIFEARQVENINTNGNVFNIVVDPSIEQRIIFTYSTGNNNAAMVWPSAMFEVKRP